MRKSAAKLKEFQTKKTVKLEQRGIVSSRAKKRKEIQRERERERERER